MNVHPTDAVSDLEEHAAEMNPNLDVIAGLRDAADWLADHPDLPPVWFTSVNFDYDDAPRSRLVALAKTLGEMATEKVVSGDVIIEGEFLGKVRVQCRVPISKLAGEPVPPRYEPILRPPVSLPVDAEDFDV